MDTRIQRSKFLGSHKAKTHARGSYTGGAGLDTDKFHSLVAKHGGGSGTMGDFAIPHASVDKFHKEAKEAGYHHGPHYQMETQHSEAQVHSGPAVAASVSPPVQFREAPVGEEQFNENEPGSDVIRRHGYTQIHPESGVHKHPDGDMIEFGRGPWRHVSSSGLVVSHQPSLSHRASVDLLREHMRKHHGKPIYKGTE